MPNTSGVPCRLQLFMLQGLGPTANGICMGGKLIVIALLQSNRGTGGTMELMAL